MSRAGLGSTYENTLNIYTDGSSFPHRKRASGVGMVFVTIDEKGDEVVESYSPPGYSSGTVDEMEIKACSLALKEAERLYRDLSVFERIVLFVDAWYVVDNFKIALNVWSKNGWKKVGGGPVRNRDLWKELRKVVNSLPIRVDIEWVKAHKKNPHNKLADKLAKESAGLPVNNPVSLTSTTSKWSSEKTTRGAIRPCGQILSIRVIGTKFVEAAGATEYRYEVIDKEDPNYSVVDFIFCKDYLKRNHCYLVQLNENAEYPQIVDVLDHLDFNDFKQDLSPHTSTKSQEE